MTGKVEDLKAASSLKEAVLNALIDHMEGGDPSPAMVGQAINFLKLFPPDDKTPITQADNRSDMLKRYAAKVTDINAKQ